MSECKYASLSEGSEDTALDDDVQEHLIREHRPRRRRQRLWWATILIIFESLHLLLFYGASFIFTPRRDCSNPFPDINGCTLLFLFRHLVPSVVESTNLE